MKFTKRADPSGNTRLIGEAGVFEQRHGDSEATGEGEANLPRRGLIARLGEKYKEKLAVLGLIGTVGLGGYSCDFTGPESCGPCKSGSRNLVLDHENGYSASGYLGEIKTDIALIQGTSTVKVTASDCNSSTSYDFELGGDLSSATKPFNGIVCHFSLGLGFIRYDQNGLSSDSFQEIVIEESCPSKD